MVISRTNGVFGGGDQEFLIILSIDPSKSVFTSVYEYAESITSVTLHDNMIVAEHPAYSSDGSAWVEDGWLIIALDEGGMSFGNVVNELRSVNDDSYIESSYSCARTYKITELIPRLPSDWAFLYFSPDRRVIGVTKSSKGDAFILDYQQQTWSSVSFVPFISEASNGGYLGGWLYELMNL